MFGDSELKKENPDRGMQIKTRLKTNQAKQKKETSKQKQKQKPYFQRSGKIIKTLKRHKIICDTLLAEHFMLPFHVLKHFTY